MTKTTIEPGLVIALDGPDGVGKTEQVKRLVKYFAARGRNVHATRSSGGTPVGEDLRAVSLSDRQRPAETDLFISLAMGAALAEDIAQRKAKGEVIIIDRSPLAVVAYNGYGSQLESKKMAFDACEVLFRKWQIDVLLFLNAPHSVVEARRHKRGTKDYFEAKGSTYHARVQEGYEVGLEFVKNHPSLGVKVVTIEAQDTIDAVHKQVLASLTNI